MGPTAHQFLKRGEKQSGELVVHLQHDGITVRADAATNPFRWLQSRTQASFLRVFTKRNNNILVQKMIPSLNHHNTLSLMIPWPILPNEGEKSYLGV